MLHLMANGRAAYVTTDEPITTDSVGMPVEVELDADFDGLSAVVCFRAGEATADVAMLGEPVTVPAQCLTEVGVPLHVGVNARNAAGDVVIPTVWANCGTVRQGTTPSGIDPAEPEPDWTAQVQQAAQDAHDTAERLAEQVGGWETDIAAAVSGAESVNATATKSGTTATVTVTDRTGTEHVVEVHDGATGPEGPQGPTGPKGDTGATGPQGEDGADGFSPTVSVSPITGGHEVTITDAQGAHSFDVMDGEGGGTDSTTQAHVAQLWANQLTKELTGEVLTAADAYAAPPMALTVDGKSTQDGTPTPDAPVEIVSVDNPELTFAGKNLVSTSGWLGGSIDVDGTPVSNARRIRSTYIAVVPATYTLSCASNWLVRIINCYDSEQAFIERVYSTSGDAVTTTLPANTAYVRIVAGINNTTVIAASDVAEAQPQLELGSTATTYEPYAGNTVTLPVDLRSLPDGTKDTLALSYLKPSTREGFAWYSRELTTNVGRYDIDAFTSLSRSVYQAVIALHAIPANKRIYVEIYTGSGSAQRGMSNRFSAAQTSANYMKPNMFIYYAPRGELMFSFAQDTFADLAAANAWLAENPLYVLMQMTTPTTKTLDPIELPVLPAPDVTVWSDPTTGLQMEYVQDTSIVIASLQAAIADLATS